MTTPRRIVCDAHTCSGRPRLEGTRLYLTLFAGHTRASVERHWEPGLTDEEWAAIQAWLASPEGVRAVRAEYDDPHRLIGRAIARTGRHAKRRLWHHVASLFGVTATRAQRLCELHGFDPDQRVGPKKRPKRPKE